MGYCATMKINFIDKGLYWQVEEGGVNTDKITYEIIGLIPKEEMCLKIDDDFSGILNFDALKQIFNFMDGNEYIILLDKK